MKTISKGKRGALTGKAGVLAVLLGVLGGLGGYTLYYAEAASYLSTDPAACTNCHIMQPAFDSWQKASHHGVAVCVDCHLPHDFVGKYIAKAENGARHSWKFTFQNFKEPIRMIDRSAAILQANCIRCHESLVDAQLTPSGAHRESPSCTQCHWRVGHGDRLGLGGPREQ